MSFLDIQLPAVHSGKVRDIYDAGDNRFLMVASDRISAFDVVMNEEVPNKGRVLTAMSTYWFKILADVLPSHLISTELADFPAQAQVDGVAGRTMLCWRADMLPIECIVRGYISGSAWKEYVNTRTMHGQQLPVGLRESDKLPEPVFTPSTKADSGHDENISYEQAVSLVGADLAEQARTASLELYCRASEAAAEKGIIIADTKFEMGLVDGNLVVADEILTPDSSRFWPLDAWHPGSTPPSYDKQPVRDYLNTLDWDKTYPPPALPNEVVAASEQRYVSAYEIITGRDFSSWPQ